MHQRRSTPLQRHAAATAPATPGASPSSSTGSSPTGDRGRFLADALSWNAIFSAASGLVLIAGGFSLDTVVGVDAWLLMVVGAGLVLFAASLLWLLAHPRSLTAGARIVVAADAAWVSGAVVLLVAFPSALAPAGRVALAVVSAVVAAFVVTQLIGLRRIGSAPATGAAPLALRVERIIPAPGALVWDAVADAGDYARFASGIADTAIVSGDGEGMVRVCTDDRGGQWAETCTLWDEGVRYRMTVDVDSYPAYYRVLLHEFAQTWTVEPTDGRTRLALAFDGAVKLGVVGRLVARVLGNRRRLEAILEAYERDLTTSRRAA